MAMKHRSPSYPAIDLEAAVGLARRIYPAAKNAIAASTVAGELGYASANSASPYLAALNYYGLLEAHRDGDERMLKLTSAALDIAVDPNGESDEFRAAVQDAALRPKLHEELWDRWGKELPPDREIRRYLERDRNFNPKYVGGFIETYKATLGFAGLMSDDTVGEAEPRHDTNDKDRPDNHPPHEQAKRQRDRRMVTGGTKEDVYTLTGGDAILQWPERLTEDEYDELNDWLDLMRRKLKRSIIVEHDSKEEHEGD